MKEIHSYLSKFDLPESSSLEKYNKSVYNDYLNYIKYYEEKNRNGIDYSEQKDNYEKPVISERENIPALGKARFKSRTDFLNEIRSVKKSDRKISNEEIISKLEIMFDALNDASAEEAILRDVSYSSLELVMNDVSNKTTKELISSVKEKYT